MEFFLHDIGFFYQTYWLNGVENEVASDIKPSFFRTYYSFNVSRVPSILNYHRVEYRVRSADSKWIVLDLDLEKGRIYYGLD